MITGDSYTLWFPFPIPITSTGEEKIEKIMDKFKPRKKRGVGAKYI